MKSSVEGRFSVLWKAADLFQFSSAKFLFLERKLGMRLNLL